MADPDHQGEYKAPIPDGARVVPQVALDPLFKSGNRNVDPPDSVLRALAASGKNRVVTTWKVCVDAGGRVFALEPLKGTGYPDWNGHIAGAFQTWIFDPFLIDGTPTAVCTAYTFIWNAKP